MGRGHTDRAQRAELPIRHPPGGDVGRSPARPPRLGSCRRCRARRGSRRAQGTREELEMGWNGTKGAPPGERVTGRWNWNWILSRRRAHAFFAGLLLFQPFFLPLAAGLNRVEALPAAEPVPLRRPAPPSSLISRHKSLPSRGFQINLAGGRRLK